MRSRVAGCNHWKRTGELGKREGADGIVPGWPLPTRRVLIGAKILPKFSQLCDNSHLRDVQPEFLERVQFWTQPLHPWIEIHACFLMIGGELHISDRSIAMIRQEFWLITFSFRGIIKEANIGNLEFNLHFLVFEEFWNYRSRYRSISKKNISCIDVRLERGWSWMELGFWLNF